MPSFTPQRRDDPYPGNISREAIAAHWADRRHRIIVPGAMRIHTRRNAGRDGTIAELGEIESMGRCADCRTLPRSGCSALPVVSDG